MSSTAEATVSTQEQQPAPVLGGVVAYLAVNGASAAAEFYTRAFGAREVFRHPVDEKGRTMHIHLHINGSSVMLSDFYPEHGHPVKTPDAFNMTIMLKDGIDERFRRALDAGATEVLPVQDMFWGDRYGQLRDPYGVLWSMNQPKR
jgi:PhnB protein